MEREGDEEWIYVVISQSDPQQYITQYTYVPVTTAFKKYGIHSSYTYVIAVTINPLITGKVYCSTSQLYTAWCMVDVFTQPPDLYLTCASTYQRIMNEPALHLHIASEHSSPDEELR